MSVIQCSVEERPIQINAKSNSFSYVWEIKEASSLVKLGTNSYRSPTFAASNSRLHKWHMNLNSPADNDLKKECLCMSLYLEEDSWSNAQVSYFIKILNAKVKFTPMTDGVKLFSRGSGYILKNFLNLSELNAPLINDILIIQCSITVIPQVAADDEEPPSVLEVNLKHMHEEKMLADITLVADDDTKYEANRFILSARSTVFCKMFTSPMKESSEKIVKISDIRSEVLGELLTYIYTDSAPNIADMASELLVAANMYDIERLVQMCENELISEMKVENIIDTLQVADKCSRAYLKDIALKYVADELPAVMNTEGFKNLNDAELLKDIMTVLAANKSGAIEPPTKRQKST